MTKIKETQPKPVRWKPSNKKIYYLIDDWGNVNDDMWFDRIADNFRYYVQGNCFKTEKEAVEHLENLKIKGELRLLAEELNNGEVIDWDNYNQQKYFIGIEIGKSTGLCYNSSFHGTRFGGVIYCLDKDFLYKAVDRIGKEHLIKMIKSGV